MRGKDIIAYSRSSEGAKAVTTNFKVSEFACNDGSDPIFIHKDLPSVLQHIRNCFGKPLVINSAYRTAYYNKQVGGASKSYHCYGMAADVAISGVEPREIAIAAEQALSAVGYPGGVGLYKSFVHVDVRSTKYRWDQRSGKEVKVNGF